LKGRKKPSEDALRSSKRAILGKIFVILPPIGWIGSRSVPIPHDLMKIEDYRLNAGLKTPNCYCSVPVAGEQEGERESHRDVAHPVGSGFEQGQHDDNPDLTSEWVE
jgi:hypothetical protein